MKEKVGTIFNNTISTTMFINVIGIPGSSISSGYSLTNESLGEGFNK
jgi:hypothetical protein